MENSSSQRKLAAIFIADAVGFSRQMGENEEGALRALKARRDIFGQAISKYRGRVFGGAGDSVIAEFPSAVDALKTAIDVQGAIAALNEAGPQSDRMLFRIGINVGDVIVERRNLFGDGVNVAERLQTLAGPGGICISGSVHEQVRDKLRLEYTDLGAQQLKNIARPVPAFLVGESGQATVPAKPAAGKPPAIRHWPRIAAVIVAVALALAGGWFYLHPWWTSKNATVETSGPPIIAVLPFANLSGDAKQDYFSDGVTQDIISALGRFSNLSVLASGATAKFKGSSADWTELRRKLGARYVVIGSVRRDGNQIRISTDLTDTDSNLHLWSRQFDGKLDDIFAVQDQITRNIAGALAIKLSRVEQNRALARQTGRLDAYDYFLRGRAQVAIYERANNLEARAMFEKAIAIDPHYAAALARLGETYLFEVTEGWTEFVNVALDRAEALGRQALKLEPELAEGHQLLAFIYLAHGEYDRAILEARSAVEINQSNAESYGTLGAALMWTGDDEGAIAALEKGRIFDPTPRWEFVFNLGYAYYLAGRYNDAIVILEPITGDSSNYFAYAILAAAYAELGRAAEAERAAAKVKHLWPFFTIASFVNQWKDEKSRKLVADGLAKAGLQ